MVAPQHAHAPRRSPPAWGTEQEEEEEEETGAGSRDPRARRHGEGLPAAADAEKEA